MEYINLPAAGVHAYLRKLLYRLLLSFIFFVQLSSAAEHSSRSMFFYERDIPRMELHAYEIMRDSQGYLWTASATGLKRFDGVDTFAIYNQPGEVFADKVFTELLEHNNSLWVGSYGDGLYRLNLSDYSVDHYPQASFEGNSRTGVSGKLITRLGKDRFNRIWVSTDKGLDLYDPTSNSFITFALDPSDQGAWSNAFLSVVAVDKQTILCATARQGLMSLDINTGRFSPASDWRGMDKTIQAKLQGKRVADLLLDKEGNILILADGSLLQFSPSKKLIKNIDMVKPGDGKKLKGRKIKANPKGGYWILTKNDVLIRVSDNLTTLSYISHEPSNKHGLRKKPPVSLSVEANGNLIITYLNDYPLFWNSIEDRIEEVQFSNLNHKLVDFYSNSALIVKDGYWLSDHNKYLIKMSRKLELEKLYSLNFKLDHVVSAWDEKIWFLSRQGFAQFSPTGDYKWKSHVYPSTSLQFSPKTGVWFLGPKRIYRLKSAAAGMQVYDLPQEFGQWKSFLSVLDNGDIYIYSNQSIYRFNQKLDKFVRVLVLPSSTVLSGLNSISGGAGTVYLSGRSVLQADLKIGPEGPVLNIKSSQHALTNDRYLSSDDSAAGLWLTVHSDQYLAYLPHGEQAMQHLNAIDGFPRNKRSKLLDVGANNQLLISTKGKLLKADFDKLTFGQSHAAKIHSIKIRGGKEGERFLYRVEGRLNIAATENVLEFSFGDLKQYANKSLRYQHRLLGHDSRWVDSDNNNVSYSALSPGVYRFQLRNIHGDHSIDQVTLYVAPPLWRSWWAYTSYGLVLLLGLGSIVYMRWRRFQLQRQAEQVLLLYARGFEQVDQGICVLDNKGNLVSHNLAFDNFLGDKISASSQDFPSFLYAEQDLNKFEQMWLKLLATGVTNEKFELAGLSGQALPIECRASKIEGSGADQLYMLLFSDISERLQHELQLETLANQDSLTLLPNRRALRKNLASFLRRQERLGGQFLVAFMDVDRFKNINDSLSHFVGDSLLKQLAKRLQSCLHEGEFVARLGGDEFVVLAEFNLGNSRAEALLKRLQQQVEQPFIIDQKEFYISLSVGVSVCPNDSVDMDQLLSNADVAMYSVKDVGGGAYAFYSARMNELSLLALRLESDLRQALKDDEFRVVYQPKVNMKTATISGFEALIRWHSATNGLVRPDMFIDAAERTGIIVQIGMVVIEKVCQQLQAWQEQGLRLLPVAINVSPQQLMQPTFVADALAIINQFPFPNTLIEFEITEGMVMENMDVCIKQLTALKNLGHIISVDDFGTGYSSLAYIRKLPIDVLKIDQSFVQNVDTDVEQQAIVKTVVELARNLKLTIVAEGIESKEIHDYLKSLACDLGQGYLYAKPLSVDDPKLTQMLKTPKQSMIPPQLPLGTATSPDSA